MSHDNRFSKTNYLKTNLLKQIKKISLFWYKTSYFPLFTLQNYKKSKQTPSNYAVFCSNNKQNTQKRGRP